MAAFGISLITLLFSLYFMSINNGFLTAFFLIISLVAFMNADGGNDDDDKQRPA